MVEDRVKMEQLLAKSFKSKNYSSFVRQLHNYGFKKIKDKKEGYEHNDFRRKNIKKMKSVKKKNIKPNDFEELRRNYELLMKEKTLLETNIKELKTENTTLYRNNEGLFSKLNMERKEFKIDLSNMMTLFFDSVKQQNPDLINIIKNLLLKNKILTEKEKNLLANSTKFISLIPLITEKIIEDKSTKNEFFNSLIDLFYDKLDKFNFKKSDLKAELEKMQTDETENKNMLEIFRQSYRFDSSESKDQSERRLTKLLHFYSENFNMEESSKDKTLNMRYPKSKKMKNTNQIHNNSVNELQSDVNRMNGYNNSKISKSL